MRRPGRSAALGAAVSVVALGAVVWWISRQEAPHLPRSGSGWAWLAVALPVIVCAQALRGWRWHLILRHAGIPHRRRDAFGLTLVGYMGNNVLPARGGELLKIGLLGARTTARRREVLGTVIVERLLDAAVLAALFAVLTWAGVKGSPHAHGGALAAVGVLVSAGVALLVYRHLRRRGRFDRFAATVRPVAGALHLFVSRNGWPLVGVTLAIWALDGLTFAVVARAAGTQLHVLEGLAVIVLAAMAVAIPAAPGYVGTFDAAVLVGLHAAGVTGGDAVGVLLFARFMLFVPVTLAGLVALLIGYRGDPAGRAALDEELVAEEPPGARRDEVASGQPGARR